MGRWKVKTKSEKIGLKWRWQKGMCSFVAFGRQDPERMCGGLMCIVGSAKLEGMGKKWWISLDNMLIPRGLSEMSYFIQGTWDPRSQAVLSTEPENVMCTMETRASRWDCWSERGQERGHPENLKRQKEEISSSQWKGAICKKSSHQPQGVCSSMTSSG